MMEIGIIKQKENCMNSNNTPSILNRILPILERFCHLGEEITTNKARLIGHIPYRGRLAYLHEIYTPVILDEFKKLEDKLKRNVPEVYKQLLFETNGLSIFWGTLSLSGYVFLAHRELDYSQARDLVIPNIDERPRDADDSFFFFGFYQQDGSGVYLDEKDGKIYRHVRYHSKQILNIWPDFETFLVSEVERLNILFNDEGRQIDVSIPTVPLSMG